MLLHDDMPTDVVAARSPTRCGIRCGTPTFGSITACAPCPRRCSVANADMSAALGMLDARHIAGDAAAVDRADRRGAAAVAQPESVPGSDELVEMTHARWRRCGEIAHRAEPDLKSGRGGLRDVQLLDALAHRPAHRPARHGQPGRARWVRWTPRT